MALRPCFHSFGFTHSQHRAKVWSPGSTLVVYKSWADPEFFQRGVQTCNKQEKSKAISIKLEGFNPSNPPPGSALGLDIVSTDL